MNEFDRNQHVAARICETLRWGGRTFQVGQCVSLLDGEVVAVAEDLGRPLRALRAIEPDPGRGMVFEVGPLGVDVIR